MIAPLRDLLDRRRDRHDLQVALDAGFPSGAPQIDRLIKHDHKGSVARATWHGARVIVKQITHDDPAQAIARLVAEHDRLRALFPKDSLKFAACLDTAPAQGIAILPELRGTRIDDVLCALPAPARKPIVTQTGAWFARALTGTRETGRFSPGFWIRMLRTERAGRILPPADTALLDQIADRLGALFPALQNGPVPRGLIHGDFMPQNILWDAATGSLSVFDVQEENPAPLAQDMARLLCDLTLKLLQLDPRLTLDRGLCAATRQDFLAAPGIDHSDPAGGFVDFATGYRLSMVLMAKHDHHLGTPARTALRHWLDHMPCP
jgi:hypothetical protein